MNSSPASERLEQLARQLLAGLPDPCGPEDLAAVREFCDEVITTCDWALAVEVLPAVLAAALPATTQTGVRHLLAIAVYRCGDPDYAAEFERAASVATSPVEVARILGDEARCLMLDGRHGDAYLVVERASRLYGEMGDLRGMLLCRATLAFVRGVDGDVDGAVAEFVDIVEQLVGLGEDRDARNVIADALRNPAIAAHPGLPSAWQRPKTASGPASTSVDGGGDGVVDQEPAFAEELAACVGDGDALAVALLLSARPDVWDQLTVAQWAAAETILADAALTGDVNEVVVLVVRARLVWRRSTDPTVEELRGAVTGLKRALRLSADPAQVDRYSLWLTLSNVYQRLAHSDLRWLGFAIAALRCARRAAATSGRPAAAAMVSLSNLHLQAGTPGDIERAVDLTTAVLRSHMRELEAGGMLAVMVNAGSAFARRSSGDRASNLKIAARHFRLAGEFADEFGFTAHAGMIAHQLANTVAAAGTEPTATITGLYQRAVALLEERPGEQAAVLDDAATYFDDHGDAVQARSYRDRALAIIADGGNTQQLSITLANRAADLVTRADRSDSATAIALLEEAVGLYSRALGAGHAVAPTGWRALLLRRRGLTLQRLADRTDHDTSGAVTDLTDAVAVAETAGVIGVELAGHHQMLGECYADAEQWQAARGCFDAALAIHRDLFHAAVHPATVADTAGQAFECARHAAQAAFATGDPVTAVNHLEQWAGIILHAGGLSPDAHAYTQAGMYTTGGAAVRIDETERRAAADTTRSIDSAADLAVVAATRTVIVGFETRAHTVVACFNDNDVSTLYASKGTPIAELAVDLTANSDRPVAVVLYGDVAGQAVHTTVTVGGIRLIDRLAVTYQPTLHHAASSRPHAIPPTGYQNYAEAPADLVYATAETLTASRLAAAVGLNGATSDATRVLHLAGHGNASRHTPHAATVAFADGQTLSVHDPDGTALVARLAVVSACHSSTVTAGLVTDPTSITTAALYAGAVGVIGCTERVDDLAAAVLVGRFFERYVANAAVEIDAGPDALREAQLWLRDSTARDVLSWLQNQPELRAAIDEHNPELLTLWADHPDSIPFGADTSWAPYTYSGW